MGRRTFELLRYLWRVTRSLLGVLSLLLLIMVTLLWVRSFGSGAAWGIDLGLHREHEGQFFSSVLCAVCGRLEITLDTETCENDQRFYESAAFFRNPSLRPIALLKWDIQSGVGWTSHDIGSDPWGRDWRQSIRMPLWLPALFGAPGVLWLLATVRAVQRTRGWGEGHCAQCGYDLRASPGVCPECGSRRTSHLSSPLTPRLRVGASVLGILALGGSALTCGGYLVARHQRVIAVLIRFNHAYRMNDDDAMIAALDDGAATSLPNLVTDFVQTHNLRMLRELIRRGFNVNATNPDGSSPVGIAVAEGDPQLLACLLDAGADVRTAADSSSLLFDALKETPNQTAILEQLLSRHVDLELRNALGRTPLLQAMIDGKLGAIRRLVEAGASPNAPDREEKTDQWNIELTPLLMITREQELDRMSESDRCDIGRLLLGHGAKLNIRDPNGCTPLHGAAILKMVDLARLLVEAGADRSAKDNAGRRPIDLVENPSTQLRQLLTPSTAPTTRHGS